MIDGLIIKAISGFYYVETADAVYECKARGVFRKKQLSPCVGDWVKISVNTNAENTIEEISERKNSLIRPPLANIDTLFIVSSVVEPNVNTSILDKLIAIAEYKDIEPVIVFTKIDLDDSYKELAAIYERAGFKTICCNNKTGEGTDEVKALINGKICAFSGNSGVGKSSLLNVIAPDLELDTADISKKLGRGKHTTRHCELFKLFGGYIADTPGFSSLDIERCETIYKDDLPYCFRDFEPYLEQCKFQMSCSHINDKGCAVKDAVDKGIISKSRHESYIQMYNEVKDIKEWERK